MVKCAYFDTPDLFDDSSTGFSCENEAGNFWNCTVGGAVCEEHKCRCKQPRAVPTNDQRAAFFTREATDVPREIRRSQLPWRTRLLAWVLRKIGDALRW